MNKYIKKPIEIEALQIHGNISEIKEFIGEHGDAYINDVAWKAGEGRPHTIVTIHTLEGDMRAMDGDYIIKGVKGEFYPCRKDIFEETYEESKEVTESPTYKEMAKRVAETALDDFEYQGKTIREWMKIIAEQEPKWIPVSERLPEEFVSVLVCYKSQGGMAQCVSERIVGFLDGNTRWSALCGQEPIAWMPLPEPYKAESEGKE